MISSAQKLQFAQQKLLTTDIPWQIRVVSYLRISCSALDGGRGHYAKLMRVLHKYDVNWWQTCRVTPTGELLSTDPIVSDLLTPITALFSSELPLTITSTQRETVSI